MSDQHGTLRYELFVGQGDPGRFVFIEHWASAKARHEHHAKRPRILSRIA